jgi:hypothetical protein
MRLDVGGLLVTPLEDDPMSDAIDLTRDPEFDGLAQKNATTNCRVMLCKIFGSP